MKTAPAPFPNLPPGGANTIYTKPTIRDRQVREPLSQTLTGLRLSTRMAQSVPYQHLRMTREQRCQYRIAAMPVQDSCKEQLIKDGDIRRRYH